MILDFTRLRRSRFHTERLVPQRRPATAANPARMRLYVMDAWVRDPAVLVDVDEVRAILAEAAAAGAATVVGDEFHVFPNGAVTGVLILAQSHLSIHTWPELRMANVDLLSYGDVDGRTIIRVVGERLGATRMSTDCMSRGVA